MGDRGPADLSSDQDQHHRSQREARPRAEPVVLDARAGYGIEWAAEHLIGGGIIALPTDTVYGIGASLAHGDALRRIFAIKERPLSKPLPILLASAAALGSVALDLDERVARLLARYWPGPLTVLLKGREGMPAEVTGPDGIIGARVPNHPVALELLERAGGAMAVTSANRSGEEPARTAEEVVESLGGAIGVVLDAGRTPGGVPSTVIAIEHDGPTILRDGAIPGEHLLATWREIAAG